MGNKFETKPLSGEDDTKPVVSLPRRANGEEYKMGEVVHGVIGTLPAEEPGKKREFDGNHVAIDLIKEFLTPEEFREYEILRTSIDVEIDRWRGTTAGPKIEKAYESAQEGDPKDIADVEAEVQAIQGIVSDLEKIAELARKAKERRG